MISLLYITLPLTLAAAPAEPAWLERVCEESTLESIHHPGAAAYHSSDTPTPVGSRTLIEAYSPRIEALREAEILLGEGDRLALEDREEEAREKWRSAAELYEGARDALGGAGAYQRLADSYLLKASAKGGVEQLMNRLGFQETDLDDGLSTEMVTKLFEYMDWEAVFDPQIQTRITAFYYKAIVLAAESYEGLVRQDISVEEESLELADDLYNQASERLDNNELHAAHSLAREARKLYHEIDYKPGELRASALEMRCEELSGNPFDALTQAQYLLRLAAKLPLGDEATETYIEAMRLYEKGRLKEALDSLQKAAKLYRESNDPSGIVNSTLDIGVMYIALGNYGEGERRLLQSLDLISELGPTDEYKSLNLATIHHNLANLYADTGRPRLATRHYCIALRSWRELGEPSHEVGTLSGLGASLRAQGRHSEALRALNLGLELQYRLSPEPDIEGDLLNNIGYVYYSKADYSTALDYYYRSLEPRGKLANPQKQAESWNNIASTLATLGRFNDALETFQSAFEAARDLESSIRTRTLGNMGAMLQYRGDYRRAIQAHSQALRAATSNHDVAWAVSSQLNLSRVYQEIGDMPAAEEHITEAIRLLGKGERTIEYAQALSILAQLQKRARRFEDAESTLRRASETSLNMNDPKLTLQIEVNLAVVESLQGDFQTALGRNKESLEKLNEIGDKYLTIRLLVIAALLNTHQGDPAKGVKQARQALDLATDVGLPTERVLGFSALSMAHLFDGEPDRARTEVTNAIEILEALHGTIRLPEIKSGFLDQFSLIYSLAVVLEVSAGRYEKAFEYAEKARSRAFLDQLGSQWIRFRPDSKGEPAALEQDLRRQLSYLQKSMDKERSLGYSDSTSARLASLSREAESVRRRYWKLVKQMRISSPEHASVSSVETLPLTEVQEEVLDDGTTLIEFFDSAGFGDDSTNCWVFAWVVERDSFQFVNLRLVSADLREKVGRLRNMVESRSLDLAASAELYDLLVKPLAPYIHNSNIVIVPHGILHYLPFAALWDAKESSFLIDTHTLTYAPSASSLKYTIAKRNPYEGRSLVIGDPDGSLPHAATEAKSVAAALGSVASLGERATERQIVERSGEVDVLHLASHGNYNEVQPFFSWIELAGDEEFDGRLETHEIFGLDLQRANLVVLSACRTALGRQTRGDEMVGMTRAFLYAGSPAVVTTLWSVDDAASAALMGSFYRHLFEATSSAEALREAQLEVKSVERWSSPYYWAAFTLTGDSHWRSDPGDAGGRRSQRRQRTMEIRSNGNH